MMKRFASLLLLLACVPAFAQRSSPRSIVENLNDAISSEMMSNQSVILTPVPLNQSLTQAVTTLSSTITLPLAPPYLGLDELSSWQTCGNCGNTGATGATASYWVKQSSSVSLDGMAAQFYINGNSIPYLDGFWYVHRAGDYSTYTKFSYGFFLWVPLSAKPQAVEFQVQQVVAGRVYNWAFQAEWNTRLWRTYNYAQKKWQATQVPVALTPGQWHYIEEVVHRDTSAARAVIDSLIVDGIVFPLAIAHDSVFAYSSTSNDLNNAFQLDTNSVGAPYSVYVDRMQLTAQ